MLRKHYTLFAILAILMVGACQKEKSSKTDDSSNNWVILFDGTSLDAWQSSSTEDMIPLCWKIENNELQSIRKEDRPADANASLVTKAMYTNFELVFEFQLEAPQDGKETNSGVKYFVYPNTELGLEYQLYATTGSIDGPHATADLYDILPARGAELKPYDGWNSVRIISNGKQCEHWLNDVQVLQFERGSDEFRAAIAKSKFKDQENFGELESGQIMLQDHGGGVKFRNIKIREI